MVKIVDPRIEEISDERSSGDGIWLYLKPGFIWDNSVHVVHENTVKACREALKYVTPCDCAICQDQLAKE